MAKKTPTPAAAELTDTITDHVYTWLGRLGLDKEWQVCVHVNDGKMSNDSPTIDAECDWPPNYRNAEMRFRPVMNHLHHTEQAALHEVCHLYTADLHDVIVRKLGQGEATSAILDEYEQLVDKLSILLLHHYAD